MAGHRWAQPSLKRTAAGQPEEPAMNFPLLPDGSEQHQPIVIQRLLTWFVFPFCWIESDLRKCLALGPGKAMAYLRSIFNDEKMSSLGKMVSMPQANVKQNMVAFSGKKCPPLIA
jgi:hypothetical protein